MWPALLPQPRTLQLPLHRGEIRWDATVAVAQAAQFAVWETQSANVLGASEIQALSALQFPRRRQSYLLGRVAAKAALLHGFKAADPREVEIRRGVFEQPVVYHPFRTPVSLSLTHTDRTAAAVVTAEEHPMGIDLEEVEITRVETIRTTLTAQERNHFPGSSAETLAEITAAWTAKEALSKVLKCGMMTPMEILELATFRPLGPAVWEGTFSHFGQYRSYSWQVGDQVLSLVLPKNSTLAAPADVTPWIQLLSPLAETAGA